MQAALRRSMRPCCVRCGRLLGDSSGVGRAEEGRVLSAATARPTLWRRSCHQSVEFPVDHIRNFSIVAHVDHGKSTLADRLLEVTGVIEQSSSNRQVLDRLPVERRRGITVKAQTATMFLRHQGGTFMLNLIDTPGHVDFSYEVSRSLAACQGVVLLVDAQQGVQAQTVANFLLAFEAGLSVIPAINKIDLGLADVPKTTEQIKNAFGFEDNDILKLSAKLGTGVEDLLPTVIDKIPSPSGSRDAPLRVLLFDSWFDHYRGVICIVAIVDGVLATGDVVLSQHSGLKYEVAEVGILQTKQVPTPRLLSGQVGYAVLGMRTVSEAHIGDTFGHVNNPITPLPGFKPATPMVFAGIYPLDQSDHPSLRTAIDKLTLNDSSVAVHRDSSVALGQGWRLGFLGLLHMDVFRQRLEEEYDASVIVTSPSVPYRVVLKDGTEETLLNPAQFPDLYSVREFLEPVVLGTLVFPDEYLGKILQFCEDRRGIQNELMYIDQSRVLLKYVLPLSEVVVDFYDQLKSISSGYASFDYEEHGYQVAPLVKLDILLNGVPVDALAFIVHQNKAYTTGKRVCKQLQATIHRQLFEVAIQAAVGKRVIARETVRAVRKNVTAKCYGGDITRKMKLLRKQKEGKKRLKQIGNVELSKEAFLSVLER